MKKITFCFLLLLALFQSQAQVLIGNGTTLKNLPINPYYGYSYTQSIYTAAEINATGNITSISWYYGGPTGNNIPNSQNLKVYLGHTSKANFSSDSDWESVSNLTEVYTGGITVNGPGWASITFTTPFEYNGTDNLVIATAELQNGYDNNGDFFVSHDAGTDRSIVYQNDTTPPNFTTPENGSRDSFVPNIIFGGIAKACPTPFFLNTVMSDSSSAMIVWGNSAQGAGDSSQYYYSQTNVAPLPETFPSGNSSSFAMISGLEPGTVYYVWVRNVCGGTPAEWSYPVKFKTECVAATSITENFDTTTAGNLPSCWETIIRGNDTSYSSIGTNVGDAFTGANSVKLNNDGASNSSDIILVLPKVNNLASGTHRLKFYADGNAANNLIIGTLNNNSSTATFTPFQNVATTSNYAEYTVNFSAYSGSDTYVGIKMNSATTYNPVFLDKIRWALTPSCPDVSGINFSAINPQSATVNWTAGGTETEWQIVYSAVSNNSNPDDLTPVTASTNPTKSLTELSSNTLYNVWVRSNCGANFGDWIGPFTLRTACEAVAAFNENFDTTSVPALPNCWTSIIRGSSPASYVNIQSYGFGANSAPNTILMTPGSYITLETENDVILVSPNLSTLTTGTHRLKFLAKGNGNIEIVTLNNNTNTAQYTHFADAAVTANMQEFTIDFSGYSGSDTYIGFRINTTATYTNTYVDDIKWELNPTCPDVSALTLQSVTSDSATISWTEGGIESAWEVVYGTPGTTDPSTLTPILTSDSSTKEITGLSDSTNYAAWVRSNCGSENGAWIGPILFKTDCLPSMLINENFDTTNTNVLPSCWTSIVRGTTGTAFAKVTTSYAHSSSKSVELYNQNQTETNDVILVSPNLGNLGAGTHRLRFHSSYHYPSSIQVGTLNNNTPNAVFTVVENININSTWTEYVVDFTQWSGLEDQYIGIRLSKVQENSYAHIDDFVWEVAPTCPDVENIQVSDVATNSAYVYWEMGELEADAWQVSYAPSNVTDASTGTISEELSAEEFVIDGLETNTEYNVWVRSVCGDLNGDWVGPIKFLTKCNSTISINENFDSTTTPTLPNCWSKIIEGSFSQFFASISNSTLEPHTAPNTIRISNSTNANSERVILVSPPLENLAAGTHQLSFYLKGNNVIPGIQVGTLNDNTSAGIFTDFQTITATTTYTKVTIDFSGYDGIDYFIGIRHSGTNNTTIYIDDIVWEPIPTGTCPAVANVNENFDTTAVDALPECWTAILRGPSENAVDSIGVKETAGVSQPNAVNIFKGLSGPQDDQILVLPLLSNLNAGTHKLAFSHAGPPCQIEVGTLNNNTDTAVFTLIDSYAVTGDWTQTIVDFTNYTGSDSYIGLRLNSGETPFLGMFIDNVIWSADLGSGKFDNSKFVYFPNPVKDILNLSYEQNITDVVVYNLLGQEIITKKFDANQTQIDMSGLASGTYIVKVTADNTNKTFKVVKE